MANRKIICNAKGAYLFGAGVVVGAQGSHDHADLRITFDADWAGLTKTATFADASGEHTRTVAITGAMLVDGTTDTYDVPIPVEAMLAAGLMSVTLAGVTVEGSGSEAVETSATVTTTAQFKVLPASDVSLDDGSITPTLAEELLDATDVDVVQASLLESDDFTAKGSFYGMRVGHVVTAPAFTSAKLGNGTYIRIDGIKAYAYPVNRGQNFFFQNSDTGNWFALYGAENRRVKYDEEGDYSYLTIGADIESRDPDFSEDTIYRIFGVLQFLCE